MFGDISSHKEIVEKVAKNLSNDDADNGGEVQVAHLYVCVAITPILDWGGEYDSCCDIDSDDPAENKETGQKVSKGDNFLTKVTLTMTKR